MKFLFVVGAALALSLSLPGCIGVPETVHIEQLRLLSEMEVNFPEGVTVIVKNKDGKEYAVTRDLQRDDLFRVTPVK